MKRLIVELDDALHKKVKMKALSEDKSMKDYIKDLVEKDLQKEKEQTQ